MSQATAREDIVTDPKLFPEGEMKAILGDEDDANKRSTALSRARKRAENATQQARRIREANPEFYDEHLKPICEEDTEERIERLEDRIDELETRLEDDDAGE